MGQVPQPSSVIDRLIFLEKELARVRKKAGISSEIISGDDEGLHKPWIPMYPHRTRFIDWPKSTAGAWETIFEFRMLRQQEKVALSVLSASSDGSTNGQMRVMMGGVQQLIRNITPGSVFTDLASGMVNAVALEVETPLTIDVQRTSGAGSIGVEVRYCYGWGDS